MKSKATKADAGRVKIDASANRVKHEEAQDKLGSSSPSDCTGKELGHFRRWWNDYQKKMKSGFQAVPLELQMHGEQ